MRREQQRPKLTIEGDFEATPCALDRPEFTGLKMDLARRMKAPEKEDKRLRRAVSDPMLFYRRLPRKPSEPRTLLPLAHDGSCIRLQPEYPCPWPDAQ